MGTLATPTVGSGEGEGEGVGADEGEGVDELDGAGGADDVDGADAQPAMAATASTITANGRAVGQRRSNMASRRCRDAFGCMPGTRCKAPPDIRRMVAAQRLRTFETWAPVSRHPHPP